MQREARRVLSAQTQRVGEMKVKHRHGTPLLRSQFHYSITMIFDNLMLRSKQYTHGYMPFQLDDSRVVAGVPAVALVSYR